MTARIARHGSRRRLAGLTAAALVTTAGLLGATLAPAAASGGILVNDGALDVTAVRTVVSWADGQQRMLLDMDVVGEVQPGAEAVLLVATPATPEITVTDPAQMEAFIAAAAPDVVEEEHWWPDLESFSGGAPETSWERSEVDLSPTEAGAGPHGVVSVEQLTTWYESNGFPVDEATAESIAHYAAGGWAFAEVRFDPGEGLVDGTTPVLDLTFPASEPVVPMVLSSSGLVSLRSSTYVLAAERLDRRVMPTSAEVRFSGPVAAATSPELASWVEPFGGTAVLTAVAQEIPDPSTLSEEIYFEPSIYGPVSAGTEVRRVERIIFGIPAGLVLVAGGMLTIAVGGVVASRLMQRRYRD